MPRVHLKAFALLALVVVVFYWKFLLTRQFSLLAGSEGANQAYAWYTFIAHSIKQGSWPLWDPYTFSGRSFAGEMQTAGFYPLNFILAAVPFNSRGVLSPALYHYLYACAHLACAYFMFCLGRRLGLSFSAAMLSGICFSLGGFVGRLPGWPHLLHSAIWLPLILLLLIRSMDAAHRAQALLYAALSGLALGMSILAGGLHLVVMHVAVMLTAGAYILFQQEQANPGRWRQGGLIVFVALFIGATSGAIQLLPSIEYSDLAIRHIGTGAMRASEKIPYHLLKEELYPNSLLGLLFGMPATRVTAGEYINPYLGVLPLLLGCVGVWRRWQSAWVRYLFGLLLAAFVFSLGSVSLLHGLSYAIIPKLWVAREASRFIFLADFALAILAGFGLDALFAPDTSPRSWLPLNRLLRWVAGASLLALAVPGIYGRPEMSHWTQLSLVLIAGACGLVLFVAHGRRTVFTRVLVFLLVLFDLHAFDWSALKRAQVEERGGDQLERLLSFEQAAAFLRSRPGLFRVHLDVGRGLNAGDLFAIPTTWGSGTTVPENYDRIRQHLDLLNVRYVVRPASASETGAVYEDAFWKIYERQTAYPRAWLVHEVAVEPSAEKLLSNLNSAGFDPKGSALVREPLDVPLDTAQPDSGVAGYLSEENRKSPASTGEHVVVERYAANQIELRVQSAGRGLVVLSELFYPGWRATVNGEPAEIHAVHHALRGVVVPHGESRVALDYAPMSIRIGGVLTLLSFFAIIPALVAYRRKFGNPSGPDG
jgi:hypothetical protein